MSRVGNSVFTGYFSGRSKQQSGKSQGPWVYILLDQHWWEPFTNTSVLITLFGDRLIVILVPNKPTIFFSLYMGFGRLSYCKSKISLGLCCGKPLEDGGLQGTIRVKFEAVEYRSVGLQTVLSKRTEVALDRSVVRVLKTGSRGPAFFELALFFYVSAQGTYLPA